MIEKTLMILTSHRLDCFKLCMDLLLTGKSIYDFDHVVLLLNGVKGRHLQYVRHLQKKHSNIPWDVISGPRGRGAFISNLQNRCVEKYPNALYFKIDEDTFVSADWHIKMEAAYNHFKDDESLSLITPVIPNNALGCYFLLQRDESLKKEFQELFPDKEITPRCDGPVWLYPHIAEWISRKYINLSDANRELEHNAKMPFSRFGERFSINCICYDYQHWREMGGVPEQDEVGWGKWIQDNNKPAVLVHDALVHHYSFFVQQDWLDRTRLLEDIRCVNLPATLSHNSLGYQYPRVVRTAKQLPSAFLRNAKAMFSKA